MIDGMDEVVNGPKADGPSMLIEVEEKANKSWAGWPAWGSIGPRSRRDTPPHLTEIYWTFYVPETLYGAPDFTMGPAYELQSQG